LRDLLSENGALGGLRYNLRVWRRIKRAEAQIGKGMVVTFPRAVAEAAGTLGDGTELVKRFDECRAAGDRAGMRLRVDVGVYDSLKDGNEKMTRLIDK
jgi:hypothetical protein